MTTIVRAPFWVPRQDDTPVWSGAPLHSNAIELTNTQAKFYGQPGQAPPFRPNLTYDDPAPWHPASRAFNRNLLSSISPFVTRYPVAFVQDDPPIWQWSSPNKSQLLKQQPFVHTQPSFYSEDAQWQGQPQSLNRQLLKSVVVPFQHSPPNFYLEPPDWIGTPQHAQTLDLVQFIKQPSPFVPRFWAFNYDDASVWPAQPVPALNLYIVVIPPLPAANVVHAIVRVTATLSNSVVSCVSSVSRVGEAGSQTEVT